MQRSESFFINALLSFSGGLQDAYTYNVRNKVFANAQTGNVVLMSQNFMSGNWQRGISYMFPVLAFVSGVFLADIIEGKLKRTARLHWRQIIIIVEMIVLAAVGFIPEGDSMLPNILVSFACAMQVHAFQKIQGNRYASTMCIGNLKNGTESLSEYFRGRDKNELHKALSLFCMIFIFALGAGTGGVLSGILGKETIWLSVAILSVAGFGMMKK